TRIGKGRGARGLSRRGGAGGGRGGAGGCRGGGKARGARPPPALARGGAPPPPFAFWGGGRTRGPHPRPPGGPAWPARGRRVAARGARPRLATREEFVKRGGIPLKGITAAAVPAALDACLVLLDRFGTMSFSQVVGPTRMILTRPQRREPWHADFARTLDTLVA